MATRTASRQVVEQPTTSRRIARNRVTRERRRLAGTLETTLQPRCAASGELRARPRVPHDNRDAAATPVREIVGLLRNRAVSMRAEELRRVAALITHPASPLYGQYSTQARYAAFAVAADIRSRAFGSGEVAVTQTCTAAAPLAGAGHDRVLQ